jgi:hypothetical protein
VLGTGYWFRNAHELLLVGTRGNVPAPAPGTQWASVVDHPPIRSRDLGEGDSRKIKHSAKPTIFHELIEAYFPNLPKIELNARRRRRGWDAWGAEAPDDEVAAAKSGDARAGRILRPRARAHAPAKPGNGRGRVTARKTPAPIRKRSAAAAPRPRVKRGKKA